MEKTTKQETLEALLDTYRSYFDITQQATVGDVVFAAQAEFHSRSERYVLVKSAKLWGAEMNEYAFFVIAEELDAPQVQAYLDAALAEGLSRIKPHKEHMYSYVTLILLADKLSPSAVKLIQQAHYHKEYLFSFHGWMDLHLAAAQLSTGTVYSNKKGKPQKKNLSAILSHHTFV